MANQFVWVDIPVLKLDRAIRFYSAILGMEVEKNEYPGMTIGTLPHKDGEVGGCLYLTDKIKPSTDGPLVYLNVHGRMDEAVDAVEPSGGRILQPKESMGPYGFRGIFLDTWGTRIALHSMGGSGPGRASNPSPAGDRRWDSAEGGILRPGVPGVILLQRLKQEGVNSNDCAARCGVLSRDLDGQREGSGLQCKRAEGEFLGRRLGRIEVNRAADSVALEDELHRALIGSACHTGHDMEFALRGARDLQDKLRIGKGWVSGEHGPVGPDGAVVRRRHVVPPNPSAGRLRRRLEVLGLDRTHDRERVRRLPVRGKQVGREGGRHRGGAGEVIIGDGGVVGRHRVLRPVLDCEPYRLGERDRVLDVPAVG